VQLLFPGVAARVYEQFEELELDESLFKATERSDEKPSVKKTAASAPTPDADDLTTKNVATLKSIADVENVDLEGSTKKADIIAKIEAARIAKVDASEAADADDEDDGIADMNDRAPGSVFE